MSPVRVLTKHTSLAHLWHFGDALGTLLSLGTAATLTSTQACQALKYK